MKDHIKLIISRNDPKFLDGLENIRERIHVEVQGLLHEFTSDVLTFADIDLTRDSANIVKDMTSGPEFEVFVQKLLLFAGLDGFERMDDYSDLIDAYIENHPVYKSVFSYMGFMEDIYEDAVTPVEKCIEHRELISILEKLGYTVTR